LGFVGDVAHRARQDVQRLGPRRIGSKPAARRQANWP